MEYNIPYIHIHQTEWLGTQRKTIHPLSAYPSSLVNVNVRYVMSGPVILFGDCISFGLEVLWDLTL